MRVAFYVAYGLDQLVTVSFDSSAVLDQNDNSGYLSMDDLSDCWPCTKDALPALQTLCWELSLFLSLNEVGTQSFL